MMAESEVQSKILNYLKFLGVYTIKTVTTNKGGVPDIIGCYRGYFIAIEVKDKGKKAKPLQLYQMKKIREAQGIAFEVDNYEEAKRIIDKLLKI